MSWSASREVADSFAQGYWRWAKGGSVLLETLAPPEAIVSAVAHNFDRYGEAEYILDRRQLREVAVVARYPQLDPGTGEREKPP